MKSQSPTTSTDNQLQSSQHDFLQDSSLVTHMPSEQRGTGAEIKIRDQDKQKKELLPAESTNFPSTLDIKLDFTIHFEDLTFGDLLGQGGYGKVFAGEWQFNTVAIKQYAAQDFSEQTKNEILKEAKVMATASTQSDYLVRLRGIVLEKPHYSLVMEYMPGGDLFHLLKSSQTLTWTMRYRISLDMTIGLHHLHQRDILHRDLKSLNVLLDNFRAKLADFGLSTLKTSSASTTSGGFKGTPLWSAPELFKRGAKATTASDLYALAIVFWELITRKIPFADAPNPSIAIDWVKSGEQENIPQDTPEEFKTIILDCWNKIPEQRPTAAGVTKRLDILWQAERKKTLTPFSSSSSSQSDSASSAASSGSTTTSTLGDFFEGKFAGKSLVTFSEPSTFPPQQLPEVKHLHPSSGIPKSLQSPEPMLAGATEEVEIKKLPEEKEEIKKNSLTRQDELIMACEQGDLEGVKLAIQRGAKPLETTAIGKYPMGAAVWGMSPDIVDYLLSLLAYQKIPSWDDIEKHNRQHYENAVWTIAQFSPVNFGEWQILIEKIDQNIVLRHLHLRLYNQQYPKNLTWEVFTAKIKQRDAILVISQEVKPLILVLDQHYQDLKLKIREAINNFIISSATTDHDLFAVDQKKQEPSTLTKAQPSVTAPPIENPTSSITSPPLPLKEKYSTESQSTVKPIDEKTLNQLLQWVAEGEQDKAEVSIQKDKNLLLHAGAVTDLSGREFKQITAFQYALWALDWRMWEMIQKYLPEEQQKEQFDELETKGTAYGKHFSLQSLIGALQVFMTNAEKVWKYDKQDKRADEYWQKVVGEAQRLLPAHVVNEYCCSELSKKYVSQFRRRTCQYYNDRGSLVDGEWFTIKYSGGTVGKSFAYLRFRSGYMTAMSSVPKGFINAISSNLVEIQRSSKIRTRQLELLACHFRKIGREDTIKTQQQSRIESIQSTVPIITISQNLYGFNAPKMGAKPLDAKEVAIFLQLVMEGEEDKAEEMIKKNSSLLLAADTGTDLAGRKFQQITAFQYALWSLDWHMWKMIQKYLPEEEQKQQFAALESKGTVHGKHFSLQPLISALQTYADKFDSTSWKLVESLRKNHWCKVVGGAQKLLPVSVVYEYCRDDRSFNPCPSFTEERPPLKSEGWLEQWYIATYNGKTCGDSFAFVRGGRCEAQAASGELGSEIGWNHLFVHNKEWCMDFLAIKSLWKTRMQQLELLASQFKSSSISLTS